MSCKKGLKEVQYEQIIDTSFYEMGYKENLEDLEYSTGSTTVYLNIHCTASKEGIDLDKQWFLDFFKNNRGWSKPGYNFLILLDGTIEILVPINYDRFTTWDEVSYGVSGKNRISINISYVGGVDKKMKPKDTRTNAQKKSLDNLVQNITCRIPNLVIMGHRDHKIPKACPSFEVSKEYGYLNIQNPDSEYFDSVRDSIEYDRNIR